MQVQQIRLQLLLIYFFISIILYPKIKINKPKNMDRFGLSLLTSSEDARAQAQSSTSSMYPNGEFNKKTAIEYLDALLVNLTSNQASPISKTMTIHVLKELTYQSDLRFISLFSGHKLLQYLASEAKSIDPKKRVQDKGENKFPNSPKLGHEYIQLILELFHFWSAKFAKSKAAGQDTAFRKIFNELDKAGVVMPKNYQYFDVEEYKRRSKRGKEGSQMTVSKGAMMQSNYNNYNNDEGNTPKGPGGSSLGSGGGSMAKLKNQLNYTKSKIELFIQEAEQQIKAIEKENKSQDKLQKIIQSNHAYFMKQKEKYQARSADLMKEEDAQTDYFEVMHFLEEDERLYRQCSPANLWGDYITGMKMAFEQSQGKKKQGSVMPRQQQFGLVEALTKPYQQPPSTGTLQRAGTFGQPANSQVDRKQMLNNVFSRLEERSKSPNTGFKAVQLELEKEKQLALKNPTTRRVSKSPRNLGRSSQAGGLNKSNVSQLRQSKIHPIFSSPPNPHLDYKNYQGQLLPQNKILTQALFSIRQEQGSRRFKVSNFRQKNPLFENQHIQVGYKSQPIYQQISDFSHFILLNIFIGNKTEQGIKQFNVEYKADTNQLLYANPKIVDSIIPAGYQNKHDLMIAPVAVPYSLMTMHIRYKFRNTGHMVAIVLPNSVLKFASYMKITKSEFQSSWRTARKYKTNPFPLCKHLAPQTFPKWIPCLESLSKYSDFSREGSQIDYQLYCMVILLQKHDFILKINVRPNLEVVLQMGILDANEEGLGYCKFYLESLELMLKDLDV